MQTAATNSDEPKGADRRAGARRPCHAAPGGSALACAALRPDALDTWPGGNLGRGNDKTGDMAHAELAPIPDPRPSDWLELLSVTEWLTALAAVGQERLLELQSLMAELTP